VAGTLVVSRPLQKVTKKVDGNVPLAVKVNGMPSAAGMPCVAVRVGKALTGSGGLLDGHDLMKAAASVYTGFKPRGVPYGFAGAISPRLKRCTAV